MVEAPGAVRAQDHLADLSDGDLQVVLVDQPHLEAGTHRPAQARRRGVGAGNDRGGDLGHVEDRINLDPEAFGEGGAVRGQRHHEGGAKRMLPIARA